MVYSARVIRAIGETLSQFRAPDTQRCVAVGGLLVVVVLVVGALGGFDGFERSLHDVRIAQADLFSPEIADEIVHVDIDDFSISELGRWPWPRATIADGIRMLDRLGARTIVLDITFEFEGQRVWQPMTSASWQDEESAGRLTRVSDDGALAGLIDRGEVQFVLPTTLAGGVPSAGAAPVDGASPGGMPQVTFQSITEDVVLAETIAEAGNVVLGLRMRRLDLQEQSERRDLAAAVEREGTGRLPTELGELMTEPAYRWEREDPIAALKSSAADIGIVNFDADRTGGRIHEFRVEARYLDGERRLSLGLAGAAHFLGISLDEIERETRTRMRFGDRAMIPLRGDGYMIVPWMARDDVPPWVEANAERRIERLLESRGEGDAPIDGRRVRENVRRDWIEQPAWRRVHRHLPMASFIRLERALASNLEQQREVVGFLAPIAEVSPGFDRDGRPDAATVSAIEQWIDDVVAWQFESDSRAELARAVREMAGELESEVQAAGDGSADPALVETVSLLNASAAWLELRSQLGDRMEELRGIVEGKLVFVGMSMTGSASDVAPSPLGEQTPGVCAHAAIANALLTDPPHLLRPTHAAVGLSVAGVLGLFSVLTSTLMSTKRSWIALFLVAGGVTLMDTLIFDAINTVVSLGSSLNAIGLAYVGCTTYRAIQFRRERATIRAQFAARVSPQLVDILVDNPDLMNMAGESREITTLFTDFAGFTAVSESLTDKEIVGVINLYLRELADVLMEEGAYINKFLGDGIMAFWGAPTSTGDEPTHGLRAAVRLYDVMERVNAEQAERGFKPLGMRCGMSTGMVIVGDCGAPPRLNDYTVIGDAVNLAARLESAAKQLGANFLVTQQTIEQADAAFVERIHWRPIGKIRVVGQTKGQPIAEVVGWKFGDERDAEMESWINTTAEAVRLFQAGAYAASQELWQDLVLAERGSAGAILYAERCASLIESGGRDEMLPLRSK